MSVITINGQSDKYVFSILNKEQSLPVCSGFYILVDSPDKHGIRNRKMLDIGYSANLAEDRQRIVDDSINHTHVYVMPDFERDQISVISDISSKMIQQKEDDADDDNQQVNG